MVLAGRACRASRSWIKASCYTRHVLPRPELPSNTNVEMVLLDPDAFLTQLTRVLEKNRSGGTIYITMKRCARAP